MACRTRFGDLFRANRAVVGSCGFSLEVSVVVKRSLIIQNVVNSNEVISVQYVNFIISNNDSVM